MLIRTGMCVLLAGALIGAKPAAQGDAWVGTWKLDVARSTYSSNAPKPKELTLTITNEGTKQLFSFNGTAPDGSPITGELVAPIGGGPMDLTKAPLRNTAYDSAVLKKIDGRTEEIVYSKDGKEVATRHIKMAANGKTLTARYAGPDSQGQTITENDFWRKQ